MRGPGKGFPTRSTVTFSAVDDSNAALGIASYVQPDMVYRVEEADRMLSRTQVVDGTAHRQEFDITDEGGLPGAPSLQETTATTLTIDGVPVSARTAKLERTVLLAGGSATTSVTHYWVLTDDPEILLRRSYGEGSAWSVVATDVKATLAGQELHVVETKEESLDGKGGHVIKTIRRSPKVPGHVVESIVQHFRKADDTNPWLVTHERVSKMEP